MSWDDKSSPEALERALAAYEWEAARALVNGLVEDVESYDRRVPAGVATRVLDALRRVAWFNELAAVAASLQKAGQNAPQVRHQLAQGLIEKGCVTRAIDELLATRDALEKGDETPEWSEITGLLGRAYKQLYVNAQPTRIEPREHDWQRAVDYYKQAYEKDASANTWHGVNCIALLTHRARVATGDPKHVPADAEAIAEKIVDTLDGSTQQGALPVWDLASRAEALLALGDNKRAVEGMRACLDAGVDRFMVQSALRQLTQLWRLTADTPPGSHIVPMMQARLGELGGRLEIKATKAETKRLEQVFGDTSYQPLNWLSQALERARCVARIGRDLYAGLGTGFLFDGSWIADEFAGRKLLLTNAHVCTSDEEVRRRNPYPLPPDEVVVAFFGAVPEGTRPETINVVEEWFTSPPEKLDATLLEIASIPDGIEIPPLGI